MKPEQLRMARNTLRLGVRDLAELSNVSFTTINRFENERGGIQHANAEALRKALELRGIQFLDPGQVSEGYGVALRDSEDD